MAMDIGEALSGSVALVGSGAVVGAIVGSVATVAGTHVLNRARPRVVIRSIRFDPLQSLDKDAIAKEMLRVQEHGVLSVPAAAREALRENPYVDTPPAHYDHPLLYVHALNGAKRDIEKVRRLHSDMPGVVRDLEDHLRIGRREDFLILMSQYHNLIWGQLAAKFVLSNFRFLRDIGISEEIEKVHPISVDVDGDFFVNIGKWRIPLPWSNEKVHQEALKEFAAKVAWALATEHDETMREIVAVLKEVQWLDPSIAKSDSIIDAEIRKYNRLVVEGVLFNAGRTSVAVSGDCSLSVAAQAFEYSGPNGRQAIHNDIQVELGCVDDTQLLPQSSLAIPPGGALPFVARSHRYLSELERQDELEAVFGSERMASIKFTVLGSRRVVASPPVRFRGL